MLHTELYKIEGRHEDVHETDFFREYVPPEEAHPSTTRPVTQTQDSSYIVRMKGNTSPAPKEKKKMSGNSDNPRHG